MHTFNSFARRSAQLRCVIGANPLGTQIGRHVRLKLTSATSVDPLPLYT